MAAALFSDGVDFAGDLLVTSDGEAFETTDTSGNQRFLFYTTGGDAAGILNRSGST